MRARFYSSDRESSLGVLLVCAFTRASHEKVNEHMLSECFMSGVQVYFEAQLNSKIFAQRYKEMNAA